MSASDSWDKVESLCPAEVWSGRREVSSSDTTELVDLILRMGSRMGLVFSWDASAEMWSYGFGKAGQYAYTLSMVAECVLRKHQSGRLLGQMARHTY